MDNRRNYIGGSDVAAILGLSPYCGPRQLWELKRGLRESEDSPMLRAGHALESFILSEYERTGAKLIAGVETPHGDLLVGRTIYDRAMPFMAANVDAIARRDGRLVVVDAKFSRRPVYADDPESIPDEWALQLHHYAWVLDSHDVEVDAEIAICRAGGGLEVDAIPVALDLGWYDSAVMPQLVRFWECVQSGEMPPAPVYVERNPLPVVDSAAGAAARYLEASAAVKAAEEAKEAAKLAVLAACDAAGRPKKFNAGPARVSVIVSERESIDTKALRADLPDVAARYTRTGEPSVSIRVTERK